MRTPSYHPMERLLHRLAGVLDRHPHAFIWPQLVLCGGCLLFSAMHLELRTDSQELFSSEERYLRDWRALTTEFQVQEDLVALVESADIEKNRQFVERLAARLTSETNLFRNVFYKLDLRGLGPKGLLFLPEHRLEEMRAALREAEPLLRMFSSVTNLPSLFLEVEGRIRSGDPEQAETHPLIAAVPALKRIVEQGADSVRRPGTPPSPGLSTLFTETGQPLPGEYLSIAGGRFYALTCGMVPGVPEEEGILRLRELARQTQRDVSGVNVGVTGQPVLRYEETRQARSDTLLASGVALVVVALTFIFCYHEVGRPLKATACLLVGIGYTLGFVTLTLGHLNILTITFVPILIGLAIDFGVHFVTRYEEELRDGRDARVAVDRAMLVSGTGICTGGLTIAGAFLSMTLTGFAGIRQMGWVSGGGLLLCLVPMMTMLPALLLMESPGRRMPGRPSPPAARCRRERLEQIWLKRPRAVVAVGGALTLLGGALATRVPFDYNLLNLQSPGLPAVQYERKMMASSARTMLAGLVVADDRDEALAWQRRLEALPTVAAVDSVAPLLVEDQDRKLECVRGIQAVASSVEFAPMDNTPLRVEQMRDALDQLDRVAASASHVLGDSANEGLMPALTGLREAIDAWRRALDSGIEPVMVDRMTRYQQALFADLAGTLEALRQQNYRDALRAGDLPPGLESRFIGRSGKFLLQVYPRQNIWEREPQADFVRELRSVAPRATGAPVRFFEYTERLNRSVRQAVLYALAAILAMLLLHFRNLAGTLLALVPVAAGITWTLGVMVVLNLPLNPANVIAFTLLLGIGVSNGVHILNRFTEQNHPGILGRSTGKAVLVSSLTTAAGFGSLMLAEHAGIASLGQVMAIGATLCMLAALTLLPALLLLMKRNGWKLAHGWLAHKRPHRRRP